MTCKGHDFARVTIILTTAEFHTMRMQNGTRLFVLLEMRQHTQANRQFRMNGATRSLQKFTENIKGETAQLLTIVDDCRIHDFTEIAKMAIAKSC